MALGEPNSLFKAPKAPELVNTKAKNFYQQKNSPYAKGYESPLNNMNKEGFLGSAAGFAAKQFGLGAANAALSQTPVGALTGPIGKGIGAKAGYYGGLAHSMGVGDMLNSTNPSNRKQASLFDFIPMRKLAEVSFDSAKKYINAGSGAAIAGEYMLPLLANHYPNIISPDRANQVGHYLGQLGLGGFAATTAHDLYKNKSLPDAADLGALSTMMLASQLRHKEEGH